MATNTSLKKEISNTGKKTPTPEQQLHHTLNVMGPEIQRALPKHMDADRIARIALTAVRTTPKLLQTDQKSFLAALMQASQLGLEPNTPLGHAYLIPYGAQTQFQLGYQGLLDLAYRTGEYQVIYAKEVFENDEFHYEFGLNPDLKHVPSSESEGEPVGYYAVYRLKNGGYNFEYWPRAKVLAHAKSTSKSFKNGPWQTNFDAMAKKTVIKSLLKYAPKSIEFAESLTHDEKVMSFDENKSIIDITPNEADMEEVPSIEEPSVDEPQKPSDTLEEGSEVQGSMI